jgi:hypothetical protein
LVAPRPWEDRWRWHWTSCSKPNIGIPDYARGAVSTGRKLCAVLTTVGFGLFWIAGLVPGGQPVIGAQPVALGHASAVRCWGWPWASTGGAGSSAAEAAGHSKHIRTSRRALHRRGMTPRRSTRAAQGEGERSMFYREAGDYKTSYAADSQTFPIAFDRFRYYAVLLIGAGVIPFIITDYWANARS